MAGECSGKIPAGEGSDVMVGEGSDMMDGDGTVAGQRKEDVGTSIGPLWCSCLEIVDCRLRGAGPLSCLYPFVIAKAISLALGLPCGCSIYFSTNTTKLGRTWRAGRHYRRIHRCRGRRLLHCNRWRVDGGRGRRKHHCNRWQRRLPLRSATQ